MSKFVEYGAFRKEREKLGRADAKYLAQLQNCVSQARNMAQGLMCMAVNLASVGPWCEQGESCQVDETCPLCRVAQSDDKNVASLVDACNAMVALASQLRTQAGEQTHTSR